MSDGFKKVLYRRQWLNPPSSESTASVAACVDASTYYTEGSLEIRDCNRKVELLFPVNTKQELAKSLKKVDLLSDILAEMRAAIVEAHETHVDMKQKEQKRAEAKKQARTGGR